MAHSKRNTSRPIFTSHERAMARAAWGSSTARLTRDSFLPFASCWLCLEPSIDPVACAQGDIFCRECALSNILAQKKEIRRAEKAREQEEREAREEKARQDAEAQERAIREFELTQAGLSITRTGSTSSTGREKPEPLGREGQGDDGANGRDNGPKAGEKRKFSLDPDEVARIAEEERAKARKAIDDEKASKPTLPSFWSPSVTPSSNSNNTLHEVKKKVKTQPVCPASAEDKPHYYSLHTLITINFTEETDSSSNKPQRICPACKKALSNSSRATLAKPCGHVLCKSCVDQFMKPSGGEPVRCYVCEADLTEKKESSKKEGKEKIRPGLVELRREGTGFSAGGSNQVKKDSVTFRC
ncbi:nitric oxide synthase-interacting protein [Corynascus novoguineensis]|uniref:Nitric oxide synthase-interacting protein n=1 Tax=Corynascus novoguineensis TaxID=1126955 RepID=A0AAN7D151_9PEZI|nr:nitric oxide synthase-interacting protein [Corynascus novoguineensis]